MCGLIRFLCLSTVILVPTLLVALSYFGSQQVFLSGMTPAFVWGIDTSYDIDSVDDELVKGKTILITGANSGLGYQSAEILLKKGAVVVMGCRTKEKCQSAVDKMGLTAEQKNNAKIIGDLELSSLKSVKNFVELYKESGLPLDVLMLNAGIMMVPYSLTEDGIESTFAVNHIGHAALTFGLVDILMESKYNPRIPVVSSAAMLMQSQPLPLTLDAVNNKETYDPTESYARSKRANLYFASELQRKLDAKYPEKKVYVNTIHPGTVSTELTRYTFENLLSEPIISYVKEALKYTAWDERTGALTQLGVAVDPSIEQNNIKGSYFYPVFREFKESLPAELFNEEIAARFWQFTLDILSQYGIKTDL